MEKSKASFRENHFFKFEKPSFWMLSQSEKAASLLAISLSYVCEVAHTLNEASILIVQQHFCAFP